MQYKKVTFQERRFMFKIIIPNSLITHIVEKVDMKILTIYYLFSCDSL